MSKQSGFNLMELMIALAIIGILAVISIPSYTHYTRKAYFTEVVQAASVYKAYVVECYFLSNEMSQCNTGQYGIPAFNDESGAVHSIQVQGGQITVTPNAKHGIKSSDTYVLTAVLNHAAISWRISGGAVASGLVSAQS